MEDPVEAYFKLESFFSDIQTPERKIGKVIINCTECGALYEECECDRVSEDVERFQELAANLVEINKDRYQSFAMRGVIENYGETINLDIGEKSMPVLNLDIDEIMSSKYMYPAPYGDIRTQKTVVNSNVRTAFQCNSEHFEFISTKPAKRCRSRGKVYVPGFLEGIKHHLNEKLFRDDQVKNLVPYRLNVYGEGGFFKAHVDTPKDPARMIGSLVVCLPTKHTGGDLLVTHQGEVYTIDFSRDSKNIQWAAFFSDCKHEVKEVTSGYRVTITFNIMTELTEDNELINGIVRTYSKGISKMSEVEIGPSQKWGFDKLYNKIQTMPENNIGVILSHEYPLSGLCEENLKGIDHEIYTKMKNTGNFECHLISAIYDSQHYYYNDCDAATCDDVNDVYLVKPVDWSYYRKNKTIPVADIMDNDYCFVLFDAMKNIISERERESAYTGNETCQGEYCYVYFMSALLLKKKYK